MSNVQTFTDHTSGATLREIAVSHARSIALRDSVRAFFADLARGVDVASEADPEFIDQCFFEAALTCATRAGQSMMRRRMAGDLYRLRAALLAGETISSETATITLTVEAGTKREIRAIADTLRRFKAEGATITSAKVG